MRKLARECSDQRTNVTRCGEGGRGEVSRVDVKVGYLITRFLPGYSMTRSWIRRKLDGLRPGRWNAIYNALRICLGYRGTEAGMSHPMVSYFV